MKKEFTKEDLQKFLQDTYKIAYSNIITVLHKRPRIICNDGFSASLQASADHYCLPTENLENGNYTKLEMTFLSEPEEELKPYANYYTQEDDFDLKEVISFGYIPIDIIIKIINKHNGINYEETFKNYRR